MNDILIGKKTNNTIKITKLNTIDLVIASLKECLF